MSFFSDIGCLFFGKLFGKHQFQKIISPAKTWEGVFGGLISTNLICILISFALDDFWFPKMEVYDLFIIGNLISVLSTTGDLIESMIKRAAEVKDSGQVFPGHGGFLDRVNFLYKDRCFIFFLSGNIYLFYSYLLSILLLRTLIIYI